ncbi:hypothetical protein ACF064_06680 [Streptomyces sp. NPDC015492]|uniref:hypothetical protein n=1 Tax=unclassified Streptomyces TaxID=2593676 RepID=UPI0033F9BA4B
MDGLNESQASTRLIRLHQQVAALRLMPRACRRLNDTIDLIRLRLDVLPEGLYQPVPGLPVRKARRAAGSRSRWTAMEPVVARLGVRTAKDIGSNAGYFPIKLAELGILVVALEADPRFVRTTTTAVRRNRLDNVAVMALELRTDTLGLLPTTDCTLLLSLWHHLVKELGLETATQLLRGLWDRTDKVLFFDTGEAEMPDSFGLPRMTPTPDAWLTEYLRESCAGARVEHLGRHRAFDADGLPAERALFAVVREPR